MWGNSCIRATKSSSKITHQETVIEAYVYLSHARQADIRKHVGNVRNTVC